MDDSGRTIGARLWRSLGGGLVTAGGLLALSLALSAASASADSGDLPVHAGQSAEAPSSSAVQAVSEALPEPDAAAHRHLETLEGTSAIVGTVPGPRPPRARLVVREADDLAEVLAPPAAPLPVAVPLSVPLSVPGEAIASGTVSGFDSAPAARVVNGPAGAGDRGQTESAQGTHQDEVSAAGLAQSAVLETGAAAAWPSGLELIAQKDGLIFVVAGILLAIAMGAIGAGALIPKRRRNPR